MTRAAIWLAALAVAIALHATILLWLSREEGVIVQGRAGTAEMRVGNSFADLVAGVTAPAEAEEEAPTSETPETVERETPQDRAERTEPADDADRADVAAAEAAPPERAEAPDPLETSPNRPTRATEPQETALPSNVLRPRDVRSAATPSVSTAAPTTPEAAAAPEVAQASPSDPSLPDVPEAASVSELTEPFSRAAPADATDAAQSPDVARSERALVRQTEMPELAVTSGSTGASAERSETETAPLSDRAEPLTVEAAPRPTATVLLSPPRAEAVSTEEVAPTLPERPTSAAAAGDRSIPVPATTTPDAAPSEPVVAAPPPPRVAAVAPPSQAAPRAAPEKVEAEPEASETAPVSGPRPRARDLARTPERAQPAAQTPDQRTAEPARRVPQGNSETNERRGSAQGSETAPAANAGVRGGTGQEAGTSAAASNYPGLVQRQIGRVRRSSTRETGTVWVNFTIAAGGGLSAASIARSSGSARLDSEALRIVQRAAPFPPPPPGAQRVFQAPIVIR